MNPTTFPQLSHNFVDVFLVFFLYDITPAGNVKLTR